MPCTLLVHCEQISSPEKISTILSLQNIKSELDQKEIESWQKLIRMINHEITNSLVPITSISSALNEELMPPKHQKIRDHLDQQSIAKLSQGISLMKTRWDKCCLTWLKMPLKASSLVILILNYRLMPSLLMVR